MLNRPPTKCRLKGSDECLVAGKSIRCLRLTSMARHRRRAGHRRGAPPGVPKCRHQTALQSAVRDTVRTKLCRPCAPEALRTRCRAAARAGRWPFGTTRSTLTSLSMAAALMFIVGGVLLHTFTGLSPTVLAAQLTLDHMKCFAVDDTVAAVDVAQANSNTRATTAPRFICLGRRSPVCSW